MTDPLTWSPVSLVRWGGIQVRAHILLLAFIATSLLNAAITTGNKFPSHSRMACSLARGRSPFTSSATAS